MAHGSIQTSVDDRGCVMKLEGDFGLYESQQLEQELTGIIARQPKLVVVDISSVTLLATIAIGAFLAAGRGLAAHGGKICLAAPNKQVAGSLKYARINDLLSVFETLDAAYASV